ncbi:MAG: hypothetical protein RLZZ385_240 [Pseudomonadota bacterium]|jgi:ABC-type uncharacterized transport system permease subunit
MPLTVISGLFAVVFYLLGVIFQGQNVTGHRNNRNQVLGIGFLAATAHALSAFGVIRTDSGYHFGIVEISTLITLSISLLVLFSSLRKPLENLLLGLFPLAIITIVVSLTVHSDFPPTSMGLGLATHVLLSIIAYSFITIAAMQAGFLAFQNHQLKHHHAGGLISKFPPLQDMEVLLFELLWVGEVILTLGIIAGFLFVEDLWAHAGIVHKTFFSLLAWVVFAILLWGRHQIGWRGRTAIRFTVTGFVFLLVGFYGSKFALEYVFN